MSSLPSEVDGPWTPKGPQSDTHKDLQNGQRRCRDKLFSTPFRIEGSLEDPKPRPQFQPAPASVAWRPNFRLSYWRISAGPCQGRSRGDVICVLVREHFVGSWAGCIKIASSIKCPFSGSIPRRKRSYCYESCFLFSTPTSPFAFSVGRTFSPASL